MLGLLGARHTGAWIRKEGKEMAQFLRVGVVGIPIVLLLAMIGARPAVAASAVGLYLMPSPDDPTNSGFVQLGCGWHWDCTYPEPDDPMYGALDFWKNPCCDYDGEPVLWRVKGYWYDSVSTAIVGRVVRAAGWQGLGCDYVTAEMYKLDGTLLGRAMYYHTRPASLGYERYIYANRGSYKNVNTWGWMSTDNDGCPWTGYHVHQDSQINVGVMTNWSRGPYPYKADCFGCGALKSIWAAYQVWFSYNR